MRHSADAAPGRGARGSGSLSGSFVFAITALLALSCLLFGYGVFLHTTVPPVPAAPAARVKPVPAPRHGRRTVVPVKAAPAPAAPPRAAEEGRAYGAMLAGGIGLLLAALCGLGLARRVQATAFREIRALLEVEKAAWNKQRDALDAQREKLDAQLQAAQQDKAEVEHLRQYASRQFQEFFRTLPVACFCFSADGKIVRWNAACEELYGLTASEAMDSTLWETLVPEEEREAVTGWIRLVLTGQSVLDVERRDKNARGETFPMRCSMVPLRGIDGEIIGGLSAGMDLSETKQYAEEVAARDASLQEARVQLDQIQAALEARQSELARLQNGLAASADAGEAAAPPPAQDVVTGLCSHRTFRERLRQETERAHRYHTSLSVIAFDLDGFGAYTQAQGFEAGDLALQNVAALIESKIRTVDVAARCDADMFALILPETGDAGTRVAVDRLRAGLAGLDWPGPPLTACFGVALLAPDAPSAEALLAQASEALRGAKTLGPNTVARHGEVSVLPIRKPRRKEPVAQTAQG